MAGSAHTNNDDSHVRVAKIGFKQAIWVALIGLASAALGYFATLYVNQNKATTAATAPFLSHSQCSFLFRTTECTAAARNTAEVISASATTSGGSTFFGTRGQTKFGLSCLGPVAATGDTELTILSIVVASSKLEETNQMKTLLRATFAAQLRDAPTRSRFLEACSP